jgi:hypothetical protein
LVREILFWHGAKKGIDARAAYATLILDAVDTAALSGHPAYVFGRKGQERQLSRAFNRHRQFALMTRARADFATRANLAAVCQVTAQLIAVLVINDFVFVFAIDADAALRLGKAALSFAIIWTVVSSTVRTRIARAARPAAARRGTAA